MNVSDRSDLNSGGEKVPLLLYKVFKLKPELLWITLNEVNSARNV